MISVIVPTMWKFEPFSRFLNELVKIPVIGEIIIINNDVKSTPLHSVLNNPKIKMLNQKENIFVNPAWNLGVEASSNNLLCFLNDDVIADIKLFYKINEWLTDEMGVVGVRPEDPNQSNVRPFINGDIDIIEYSNDISLYAFGTLFFIHRNNWVRIPESLRMGFGDNWVFDSQHFIKNKKNYLITNIFYYHAGQQTSKTFPDEFYGPEKEIYMHLFNCMAEGKQITELEKKQMNEFEIQYQEACKKNPSSEIYGLPGYNFESDIYEHLPTLRSLAEEVESVVELGVRDGQSTRAFLVTNCKLRSYDLNLDPRVVNLFQIAKAQGKDMSYQVGNSLEINIEPTDLLFIDTDHTYKQLSVELERHHSAVRRYIAMHDTTSAGLPLLTAIIEFLSNHSEWKVKKHYSNCNGLTILERATA